MDKINQHKRIPISIGIAAACALIMFNTGIFDTMKPTDYNNHQTTQIKQNAPETAMPDKAPTQGGDNSSQTESIPSNQQDNKSSDGYNTPVEDNLPKESEKPIDKEKTFENEQPQSNQQISLCRMTRKSKPLPLIIHPERLRLIKSAGKTTATNAA